MSMRRWKLLAGVAGARLLLSAAVSGASETGSPVELARQLNQVFADVAQRVSPAVVIVNVVQKVSGNSSETEDDAPYDSLPPGFWKKFHEQFKNGIPELSVGSGVVIREDGYILTNHHVV